MTRYDLPGHPVWSQEAWQPAEVRAAVEACLTGLTSRLPAASDLILIKPDLSNDRLAISGGTTDLRVLVALVEALKDRGFRNLAMGDTPPPAYHRVRVEPFRRLRIDRFARRFGVRWLDLNRVPSVPVKLPAGEVRVARATLEASLLINVPTIRTHPEAGLLLGAWNLKGLVHSGDRHRLATALPKNLLALAERIRPGITLLDGLVAMEGDGPLDGSPLRLGRLFWGENTLAVDLVVARLLGFTPEEVPHLWDALYAGALLPEVQIYTESHMAVFRDVRRPRSRGAARRTGHMVQGWLAGSIRRRSDSPGWARVAEWMQLRTPVAPGEDGLHQLTRHPERCGTCYRCEAFCPVGLTREEIGTQPAHDRCIECLYCFQVCGRDALTLEGEGGPLLELIKRDKLSLVAM